MKKNQHSQSEPVSGSNSPTSSSDTSRAQSPRIKTSKTRPPLPPLPPPQHKYSYLPWLIGSGIVLPIVYGGTRWFLNRPSVQALINRKFNKGSNIVESATVQPTTSASEDSKVLPSHTPLPISTPVGAEDL